MARKKISNTKSFTENLHVYIESQLSDLEKINIAKKSYLFTHKDEIYKAIEMGYSPKYIAQYATEELLKTNIPKTFTRITSEDETIEGTPKITPMDIKKLCEINK